MGAYEGDGVKLTKPRHCHYSAEGMSERTGGTWTPDGKPVRAEKYCPNWVNQRKPRKVYWRRWVQTTEKEADRMCWAYICDWCWDEMTEATLEDWEGWPQGDDGKFIGSTECSLP